MQEEIKKQDVLLDESGNLKHAGYATSLILDYDRNKIKAKKMRIKEWDYYLIYNKDYGVALTIDDNYYMGLVSASFLNFKEKWEKTVSPMFWFPKGSVNLPASSKTGDSIKEGKGYSFKFINKDNKRILDCSIDNFIDKKPIKIYFELTQEPKDSMVIATPFNKDKHFYYNQKIVGFKAIGKVEINEETINFEDNTYALLDWGRGVWTYKNTWYWGAGCEKVENDIIGFNFGYGFGDTSKASENMIFINGEAIKIDKVTFNIPTKKGKDDYLSPWSIISNDGVVNFEFSPIIDRKSNTNAIIIQSNQHQVFGTITGTITLKDRIINIKDYTCFFEKVINRW
jgi:hypothetical protein